MLKFIRIFLLVLIIIGIGLLSTQKFWVPGLTAWILVEENIEMPAPIFVVEETAQESIAGCYVAHLAKDVYTLDIQSEKNGEVSGRLAFNNFEKDSSAGTFTGTYSKGVLSGYYSFTSEGMNSSSQVMFKKVSDGFVRGFGPMTAEGDTAVFENPEGISYDSTYTFVKSDDCSQI